MKLVLDDGSEILLDVAGARVEQGDETDENTTVFSYDTNHPDVITLSIVVPYTLRYEAADAFSVPMSYLS